MNESTVKIKSCPYCGWHKPEIRGNGIGDYYVICAGADEDSGEFCCGACSSDARCETEAQAIERWNRRHSEDAGTIPDVKEKLGQAKEEIGHLQEELASLRDVIERHGILPR